MHLLHEDDSNPYVTDRLKKRKWDELKKSHLLPDSFLQAHEEAHQLEERCNNDILTEIMHHFVANSVRALLNMNLSIFLG